MRLNAKLAGKYLHLCALCGHLKHQYQKLDIYCDISGTNSEGTLRIQSESDDDALVQFGLTELDSAIELLSRSGFDIKIKSYQTTV
jgi:hypothetical protein